MSGDFERLLTRRVWTDEEFAAQLESSPVEALRGLGVAVPSGIKVKVVVQRRDRIYFTIPPARDPRSPPPSAPLNQMVPPRPEATQDLERELTRVTEQVFDLLFSSGIGGYFIPDDAQKWVLQDMRLASQKKAGPDVSGMPPVPSDPAMEHEASQSGLPAPDRLGSARCSGWWNRGG